MLTTQAVIQLELPDDLKLALQRTSIYLMKRYQQRTMIQATLHIYFRRRWISNCGQGGSAISISTYTAFFIVWHGFGSIN